MKLRTRTRVSDRRRSAIASAAFLAGLILPIFMMMTQASAIGTAATLALFGYALQSLVRFGRNALADVEVSTDGVRVNGRTTVDRADLEQGYFLPAREDVPARVVLRGNRVDAQWEVTGETQANEALALLGQDGAHHTARFRAVTAPGGIVLAPALLGVALVFVIGLLWTAVHVPALLLLTGAALVSMFVFGHGEIHVGHDGVLIKNRLTSRFIATSAIASVKATKRGVHLDLGGETPADIVLTSTMRLRSEDLEIQTALIERIRAVMSMASDPRDADAVTVGWRLDRAARPYSEWLASLVSQEAIDFRHAPLRTEDLYAVLDGHHDASPSARLGAAVVLARRGGEDERSRIRIAAEASAAPKLRIAFETVANANHEDAHDEARLEAAVLEAEEEQVKAQRSQYSVNATSTSPRPAAAIHGTSRGAQRRRVGRGRLG